MDREAVIAASEIITGSDFYQQQYGIMFDAMVELFNEGKPVDLVTLQDRLKEKDVPPEVSSLDFVRDIITIVPTSANVKSYATIVSEKAVLRRIRKNLFLTCSRTRADRNLYPSSRLPSMFWKRSRMHIKTRERLPVSLPDLLIWIINCPVSSLPILS